MILTGFGSKDSHEIFEATQLIFLKPCAGYLFNSTYRRDGEEGSEWNVKQIRKNKNINSNMVNDVNYLFDLDTNQMYTADLPLQQAGPGMPSVPM